jgi:hypothetical protein
MSIAGIRPAAPGFTRCTIRPQPADLKELVLAARTVLGDIRFSSRGMPGDRMLELEIPAGMEATLLLNKRELPGLTPVPEENRKGLKGYRIPAGRPVRIPLRFT